ncbi:MAG: oligosaccharide flippase family protein [Pseudomonadota bacterium]
MSPRAWSFVLSWSRVGINAGLFLIAARVLTLAEIGSFATAFAAVRLVQAVQKAGASDAVTLLAGKGRRWEALFVLSLGFGTLAAAIIAGVGALLSPMALLLGAIPVLNAIGAVPEGILRYRLAVRALALRTLVVQLIAAGVALWMLSAGFGPWALVGFALVNALLGNLVALVLAGWRPVARPRPRDVRMVAGKTAQIAGRVALTSSTVPLAQLAIGVVLGPAAAGAFQIATRVFELIDALSLSPLRYIALPQLRHAPDLTAAILTHTRVAAGLALLTWGATLAATEPLLRLAVGPQHASAAAPVLQALALLGLVSALTMPLTQALTATGATGLVLARACAALGLSGVLMIPALTQSATACAVAIALGGTLASLWLVYAGLPRLGLRRRVLA